MRKIPVKRINANPQYILESLSSASENITNLKNEDKIKSFNGRIGVIPLVRKEGTQKKA